MSEHVMFSHETSDYEMPGVIRWRKNDKSIYTAANKECAHFFGFQKPEEMIGLSDKDLRCRISEEAEICVKSDNEVMLTKKPLKFVRACEYKKNEQKILLINKSPLLGKNNIIEGTIAYCIDITNTINGLNNLFTKKQTYFNDKNKLVTNKYMATFKTQNIKLTDRQSECLFFLIRGKTLKEIAKFLNISPRTVESHIEVLKLKFACQNKCELIASAIDRGLFNMIPKRIFQTQLFLII